MNYSNRLSNTSNSNSVVVQQLSSNKLYNNLEMPHIIDNPIGSPARFIGQNAFQPASSNLPTSTTLNRQNQYTFLNNNNNVMTSRPTPNFLNQNLSAATAAAAAAVEAVVVIDKKQTTPSPPIDYNCALAKSKLIKKSNNPFDFTTYNLPQQQNMQPSFVSQLASSIDQNLGLNSSLNSYSQFNRRNSFNKATSIGDLKRPVSLINRDESKAMFRSPSSSSASSNGSSKNSSPVGTPPPVQTSQQSPNPKPMSNSIEQNKIDESHHDLSQLAKENLNYLSSDESLNSIKSVQSNNNDELSKLSLSEKMKLFSGNLNSNNSKSNNSSFNSKNKISSNRFQTQVNK